MSISFKFARRPVARRTVFWLALVATTIIMVMPTGSIPSGLIDWSDKAQHAFVFAVLTVFGLAAYPIIAVRLACGLGLYGGLTELLQSALPWRSADPYDFVANLTGVVGAWLIWRICFAHRASSLDS